MAERLRDRVAIVTGGAQGIGHAIAKRLLAEGASVLVVDKAAGLDDGSALGANAAFLGVDLTGDEAPALVVRTCLDRFGRLDILVNNAGLGDAPPMEATSDETLDLYLGVNLRSVFRLSREAVRELKAGGGAIVNISSALGVSGYRGQAAYTVAKAGVIGLTRQMAADYAAAGIRVNAVAPGLVATERTAARMATARFRAAVIGTTPMGRAGTPEEIAGSVAFLCSADAGFINGHILVVDGGQTSSTYVADEVVECWVRSDGG